METISTRGLPRSQRLKFWEQSVSSLYAKTSIDRSDEPDFHGRIVRRRLGRIMVSSIASTRQVVRREKRHIGRHEPSLVQINLQVEGTCTVAQDGRLAITEPGEMAIYDSSRPYEMTFEGPFRQLSIDFPAEILRDRFGRVQDFTARSLSGLKGPGRFLYEFTQSLMEEWGEGGDAVERRLENLLLDLVVTALYGLMPLPAQGTTAHRRIMVHRIRDFVEEHLRNPDLSPTMISERQGVSLRYLYDLFADEEMTIARHIVASRLDRCRRELEDPRQTIRTVADIAYGWGFNDPAHFSRAFRARFGMTPRQCRAAVSMRSGKDPALHE